MFVGHQVGVTVIVTNTVFLKMVYTSDLYSSWFGDTVSCDNTQLNLCGLTG